MNYRGSRWIVVVAFLSLLFVGCGDEEGSGSDGSGSGGSATGSSDGGGTSTGGDDGGTDTGGDDGGTDTGGDDGGTDTGGDAGLDDGDGGSGGSTADGGTDGDADTGGDGCSSGETKDCPKQDGVCSGATVECQDGTFPECDGSVYGSDYEEEEESCDGLDNDCDGNVDEDLEQACSKQQGVCSGSTVQCEDGSYPTCDSDQYGSDYEDPEESCDGLDNDCDGETDEPTACSGMDVQEVNCGSVSPAETVDVGSNYFDPSSVTINTGDVIEWELVQGNHDVTSGTGSSDPNSGDLFYSGTMSSNGETFCVQFNTAGSYPYFCSIHGASQQSGSVTVQ